MINQTVYKIRLKKGDTVVVRSGKDKGRSGKILATHPRLNKVTVEGLNLAKKHRKPTRANPQGGIVSMTRPIWVSKVGIVDPGQKNRASRISYKMDKAGKPIRIYQTSGKEIK